MDSLHAALLKKDETVFISSLLDKLDPRKIPPSLKPHRESEDDALSALWNLARTFDCLFVDPKNPTIIPFRLRYGRLLVERWSGVARWLAYLLLRFSINPGERDVPLFCTVVLSTLLNAEEPDEWQEEVIHRPQTTPLIHLLLCQTGPPGCSYRYIPDEYGCAILALLWGSNNRRANFFSSIASLSTVRLCTRDNVITSLVLRARHIAEIAVGKRRPTGQDDERSLEKKWFSAAKSLGALNELAFSVMSGDAALSKIFFKKNVVFEYAAALFVLSDGIHSRHAEEIGIPKGTKNSEATEGSSSQSQAAWRVIAQTVSGPFMSILVGGAHRSASATPAALTGGLLHAIIQCLIHLPPDSREVNSLINETIPGLVGWLPSKKAVLALSTGYPKHLSSMSGKGELSTLLDLAGQTKGTVVAQACKRVRFAMEDGEMRLEFYSGGDARVMGGMCSNGEVRLFFCH